MLDLLIVASVGCVISVVANLFHWRSNVGEAFFCLPKAGWTLAIHLLGSVALVICLALKAAKRLPPLMLVILALSLITTEQLLSIWYRQSLRNRQR